MTHMKNITTGFGLCALAFAVALYPVLDRFAPMSKESHAVVPVSAIPSAMFAQSAPVAPANVVLVPGNSLITKIPEEGRQLAIKMARLIIKVTQPDSAVREQLRPMYADDPEMLIAIGQTVATEFATIAAANNYWK